MKSHAQNACFGLLITLSFGSINASAGNKCQNFIDNVQGVYKHCVVFKAPDDSLDKTIVSLEVTDHYQGDATDFQNNLLFMYANTDGNTMLGFPLSTLVDDGAKTSDVENGVNFTGTTRCKDESLLVEGIGTLGPFVTDSRQYFEIDAHGELEMHSVTTSNRPGDPAMVEEMMSCSRD